MISLGRFKLRPLAMLVDACIVVNAYIMASLVLFARWAPLKYYDELLIFLPLAIIIHCSVNLRLGLYRSVGRYAGLRQGIRISRAAIISAPVLLLLGTLAMPSSYLHVVAMVPIGGVIAFILMAGVRFYPRIFYERSLKEITPSLRMLVVGAGAAGEMIVSSIRKERSLEIDVICLVDDDDELFGLEIHEVPIHGPIEKIPELVRKKEIDEIIIAIPSASLQEFQRIWRICSGTGVITRALKPLQTVHLGKVGLNHIKDVEIEDLLGRQPVETDYTLIRDFVRGKVVLVSGAGGSIGSELAQQISHYNPALVILADRDESALYQIHEKLSHNLYLKHEVCVMDVQLEGAVESIFRRYRPELIFHAAAYKHVPLMELQPEEAVLNNVKGTWVIASLAGAYGAECFVNISTDKAVEPVNVMGATKRLSERLVEELGSLYPDTGYRSVRFGNVLDSRGSVVPIFRRQIELGGPLTVTDPGMTRYFMLISEAADLVVQAASFPGDNGIFVLEMGQPVKIVDLAHQMISFMRPGKPIDIVFTGLRPGEKVHEQLLGKFEQREDTSHPMIYRVNSNVHSPAMVLDSLLQLFDAAESRNTATLMSLMKEMLDSYVPFDMKRVGLLETDSGAARSDSTVLKIASSSAGGVSYKWAEAE